MRNILCTLRFDGARYHGWQIQHNAVAVQEVFQRALAGVLGKQPDIKGCSRTDTGVHALMYCLNFKTDNPIPCERLMMALNQRLPLDIAVYACRTVPDEFHARYSATGKRYVYRIHNARPRDPFAEGRALHYPWPLDTALLHRAAQDFVGTHDFASFCAARHGIEDTTRTVAAASVARDGSLVTFTVRADGFLYNMVRIMVGTLLRIAQGKFAPDCIPRILAARDRAEAGPTAPPHGLYLDAVDYGVLDPLTEDPPSADGAQGFLPEGGSP